MKNFKSVSEWIKSNPSEEEQKKILNLINKGAVSETRREVYELERYYRKLQAGANHMKKLELPVPKDITEKMKEVKSKVDELKKGLPVPVKRAKKEEETK